MIRRSLLAVFGLALQWFGPASAASVQEHLRDPEKLLAAPCPGDSLELPKRFFVVCYSKEWRVARWVAYHLTAGDLNGEAARKDNFREDLDIKDEDLRSRLSDYRSTGYHKGHQTPAEDFTRSVAAMSTTFLLSNMAPQTAQLNSGKWRVLESDVRLAAAAHRGAWIFTGSLFAKETRERGDPTRHFKLIDPQARDRTDPKAWIGGGRVAVPTHSFKVILVARADDTFIGYGFVLPNQRKPLPGKVPTYQVSIETIEKLTNLTFLGALDDNAAKNLKTGEPAWPPAREKSK